MSRNSQPHLLTSTRQWSSLKHSLINANFSSIGKTKRAFVARHALHLRMFMLAVIVIAFATPAPAQVSSRVKEPPRSFSLNDKSQDLADRKVLPKVDPARLRSEDLAAEKDRRRPIPQRFAIAADVALTLKNSGTWVTVADGRIWRLRLQSPGAKSQNLGITRFDMPAGAKLWIYDPGHKHVEGPYTSSNRSHLGSLWTPIIEGEEMVVEVFAPAGVSEPVIEISKVNQGYRGFGKSGIFGGDEGDCEVDVICPEGVPWQNQIRAVNVYTVNGNSACTGNLVNNTSLDGTPYVLSANHCGVTTTSDATVVVYWNFESPTCGTHDEGPKDHTQTGAIFRASNAASDFCLFELSAVPDPSYNVFYAGWDASGTAPASTVAIHQPSADVKAISFSNTPAVATTPAADASSDTPSATGKFWRADWSGSGVTEHGSSGSCLFDASTGRCIGQLWNGPSICGAAAADLHDYYGRFSVSWTGGGTNSTRLSNWLDPGNTGALGLDGDPHITTANGVHYDFQGAGEYVSVREPGGFEIQTRLAPIATTFFPGPHPYDELATCVSLITAVAMRVGSHRVSYEPNLSGVPDPSGLQLRVDGALTTVGANGLNLGGGGRISQTSAPGGLRIDFPNGRILYVTPNYWDDQGYWYLNVDLDRSPALNGSNGNAVGSGPSGLAGTIPAGTWLPLLPDGTSMGPMPSAIHQRYLDLYQKFGNAWRVTDASSLFDYAANTSTDTFTMSNWPLENAPCVVPRRKPAEPASEAVAERACRQVKDPNARRNCVFDVRVTGHTGFARTYILTEQVLTGTTGPPTSTSTTGKWAVFLDAGAGIPHSSFSSFFNTGFSFNAGLEYMITSHVSAEGIIGYHRFPSRFAAVFGNVNLLQVSGNAKVYLVPAPNSLRPFMNGGIGAYKFSPGSTNFGANIGGGILYEFTPRFGLQGSYNFHNINTPGSATRFSTLQGGVRFVF